jgi:hypothetical protein
MTSPTVAGGAGTTPTDPTATTTRERRTRRPDLLTNVFLVLTAILAAWSVALIVLTLLAIASPSFYSFEKAPLKAAGSTVVGLLALGQLWSMETAMGHLPRAGLKMKLLMRTHRLGGRLALVLAAVVAYFCLTDVGVETNVLRGAIHGFFGSTAFVAIAIKLALIRFRPGLAYDIAPWLGRYAALAFIVVWITSAYAFYTNSL